MCDSTISTTTTTDIQYSYMGWLACKLRRMAHDILQFATYDEFNENSILNYRRYIKDAINFLAGAHTCERFLYGVIGLDAFCDEMIENELREFLNEIPNLPSELATKYNLIPYTAPVDEISDALNDARIDNDDDDVIILNVSTDDLNLYAQQQQQQ